MKVVSVAYGYSHPAGYAVERPDGVGCWYFVLLKSPGWVMVEGRRTALKGGTAILFSAESPCLYGCTDNELLEDWLYAQYEENDLQMLRSLGIPLNTPIYIGNVSELSQILHTMVLEHYSSRNYHVEIEKRYLDILLMKLARLSQVSDFYSPSILSDKNAKLSHLRTRMFSMPNSIPDVDGMAQEIGMSRSGLQHLYKRYFGVSIKKDVISGRVEYAKQLLSTTALPLEQIAEQCGYGSVTHFVNQFKLICGVTPTQYRNKKQ